ncbi:MAG: TerC family protein [Burkholderiaceae bacterium]|nr:TerC family protein [Burkholderiaceae bacterium]
MIEFLTTMHWAAVLQIIAIDILLGGDNAVVIALACRNLPKRQRTKGILWGTAGAIVLRVILVVFAVALLKISFLKIVGGLLLLWIGVRLIAPDGDDSHDGVDGGGNLISAIKTIIVADLVMSVDNVIAIAGAAQQADPDHQIGLVIFGLLVSIPIIVWGSQMVLKLIDRFPIVIAAGGALLGWIAGGMIVTDPAITSRAGAPSTVLYYGCAVAGAVLVVAIGEIIKRRRAALPRRQGGSATR